MTAVLDTSFLVAVVDADDAHHREAVSWLEATDEDLVTTPLALAEIDHFARRVGGPPVQEALWDDFDRGVYRVRWWADGLWDALAIARRHPSVDLTDASLAALASVLRTTRIATFDQHFRSLTLADGAAFQVLPADA